MSLTALAAVVVLAVGVLTGWAASEGQTREQQLGVDVAGAVIPGSQDEIDAADSRADDAQSELEDVQAQRDDYRQQMLEERAAKERAQREADERAVALDKREKALDERAAALDERESAISETEQQIEASTIGDGVYVVGEDVAAGEYRTDGADGSNPVGCYYAFKSGTGADAEIIDNNIVDGQARVTLSEGDVFESKACDEWTAVS
ncbi:hypothetical protein [Haloactinopolyspora alba]|uniref:hypothetical protein n=1 Tax=Haloactinopolyspora alba TaxID=648780 RepID=UPI000D0CDFA1|nr:hypothetical protein [Haloactinopolyspora alba]